MKAFLAAHPESAQALQRIKARPSSSGFANASYNGLNAFRFVDAAGTCDAGALVDGGRRSLAPEPAEQAASTDKNYLFDALAARLARRARCNGGSW